MAAIVMVKVRSAFVVLLFSREVVLETRGVIGVTIIIIVVNITVVVVILAQY